MTYAISSNKSSINEGENVEVLVTTTNVADGTNVPFSIFGISSSDIAETSSGNFTIGFFGTALKTFSAVEDGITEGTETMRVQINGINGPFVDITINDTSTSPTPTPS